MGWPTWYFLVGSIAAIRGSDAGCVGMILLLAVWPAFVLAGLANLGRRAVGRR